MWLVFRRELQRATLGWQAVVFWRNSHHGQSWAFGSFTNLYQQSIHMREPVGPTWDFPNKAGKLMEEAQYAT
jgi:hypothetical protein